MAYIEIHRVHHLKLRVPLGTRDVNPKPNAQGLQSKG